MAQTDRKSGVLLSTEMRDMPQETRRGCPSGITGEDATWHHHLNSKCPRCHPQCQLFLSCLSKLRIQEGGHDGEASGMRSFCSFWSVGRGDLASLAPGGGRTLPERAQQRICPKRRGVQMLGNHSQ